MVEYVSLEQVLCEGLFVCGLISPGLSLFRLWPHDAAVRRGEGLLHRVRAVWRALHHAGADGVRAAVDAPSDLRPDLSISAALRLAAARLRHRTLRRTAGRGGAGLLRGARHHLQHHRGVLVLPGGLLLLLYLPLHHRPGRLCPGGAAWTETETPLQDLRDG